MVVDYLFGVVHLALTDLDVVSVEDFLELVVFGKVLLVLVFLLKRRVVQVEDVVALLVFWFACFSWFAL